MAKTFSVTIPIAGHAFLEVEADNEDDAIERAMEQVELRHIETWEGVMQFTRGNICYCPQPWEAEAEVVDDGEADE